MKPNCSKEDYDFYTIPLPAKVFFARQKNRYISSQLEKLHPCFSDDCSYDSHVWFRKKGFIADVVVMQKFKVAEYKACKKKLYIQERKHQFFADRNKKLVIAGAFFCCFLLLIFCFNKQIPVPKSKNIPEAENDFLSSLSDSVVLNTRFLTPGLLCKIIDLGGSIKQFEWNYDGYNEKMSVCIYGIFPEQLQAFSEVCKISSVVFEDSFPVMTINLSEHIVQTGQGLGDFEEYSLFKNDFRQEIFSKNIKLTEETVNPYGIKLSVKQEQLQSLQELIRTLNLKNKQLSSIKINSVNHSINFELAFAQVIFDEQQELLECIADSLEHLKIEKNTYAKKSTEVVQPEKQTMQSQQPQQEHLQKIGQILKPDGSIISYYRNQNGKIIKR